MTVRRGPTALYITSHKIYKVRFLHIYRGEGKGHKAHSDRKRKGNLESSNKLFYYIMSVTLNPMK
jgi:hypothetical protein